MITSKITSVKIPNRKKKKKNTKHFNNAVYNFIYLFIQKIREGVFKHKNENWNSIARLESMFEVGYNLNNSGSVVWWFEIGEFYSVIAI